MIGPLEKVISGGQNGVDLAALRAAKSFGLHTGGTMPLGWRTIDGPRPEYASQFGLVEHPFSAAYPPRTFKNVLEADATLRIAADFDAGRADDLGCDRAREEPVPRRAYARGTGRDRQLLVPRPARGRRPLDRREGDPDAQRRGELRADDAEDRRLRGSLPRDGLPTRYYESGAVWTYCVGWRSRMPNAKTATGALSCHMRLAVSPAMRRLIGHDAGPAGRRLAMLVEEDSLVDGLAKQLDVAMTESTSSDGRLDLRAMAMRLIATMRENQR